MWYCGRLNSKAALCTFFAGLRPLFLGTSCCCKLDGLLLTALWRLFSPELALVGRPFYSAYGVAVSPLRCSLSSVINFLHACCFLLRVNLNFRWQGVLLLHFVFAVCGPSLYQPHFRGGHQLSESHVPSCSSRCPLVTLPACNFQVTCTCAVSSRAPLAPHINWVPPTPPPSFLQLPGRGPVRPRWGHHI